MIDRAIRDGALPTYPTRSEANPGDWRVPELPEELTRPGIEISGPVSITSMAINALNPGSDGERATGYLDDDDDSVGHRLQDTVQDFALINRLLGKELADIGERRRAEVPPGADYQQALDG